MSADVWGLIVFYKTDISRLISVSLTVADSLTFTLPFREMSTVTGVFLRL
jgi:hypothetical protein